MRERRFSGREITDLRGLLAGLALETKLLRLEQALLRKDWSDQPRAPAGQPDGGRWVPGSGGRWMSLQDGPAAGSEGTSTERTVTEDGTRVLSLRIHAGRRPFDAQHIVVAPDGESRVFETSGATQTIRDGQSGEVLARSTFTAQGAEPEARVQPALLGTLVPAVARAIAARTLELAASLFAALSARNDRAGTAAFGLTATEFSPTGSPDFNTAWVGRLSREELDAACPRAGDVQAMADAAAAKVRALIEGLSPQEFGNRVHLLIAAEVKALNNPNLKAELSLRRDGDPHAVYGQPGTVRLDVLERVGDTTVCVYDHKTGLSGLSVRRAADLAAMVDRNYGGILRIILIQVRPRS